LNYETIQLNNELALKVTLNLTNFDTKGWELTGRRGVFMGLGFGGENM
jgi:hypothetical protein